MMLFKKSLYWQLLWLLAAGGYNALSFYSLSRGNRGFAGDVPTTQSAMLFVVIFGMVTIIGILGWKRIYKFTAPIVALLLFFGGVLKHILLGPADYASMTTWVFAILINLLGTAAFTAGAIAVHRTA